MRPFIIRVGSSIVALCLTLALQACEQPPYLETVKQTPYFGLPASVTHVHAFNVARLRAREELNKVLIGAEMKQDFERIRSTVRERTGVDFLEQIDLLVVAASGPRDVNQPLKNTVFIARGRFENAIAGLQPMLDWLGEEYLIAPPPFQRRSHPDSELVKYQTAAYSQYNERLQYELHVCVPAPDLFIFSFSSTLFNQTLDVVAGIDPGLRLDEDWKRRLALADIGKAIWGVGRIPTATVQSILPLIRWAPSLGLATEFFYDLDFERGMTVRLGLVTSSIKNAETLAQELRNGHPQLVRTVERLVPGAPTLATATSKFTYLAELEKAVMTATINENDRRALFFQIEQLGREPVPDE